VNVLFSAHFLMNVCGNLETKISSYSVFSDLLYELVKHSLPLLYYMCILCLIFSYTLRYKKVLC
jgi:hypothetical protein